MYELRTLYVFELKKIWKRGIVRLGILIVVVFAFYSALGDIYGTGMYHRRSEQGERELVRTTRYQRTQIRKSILEKYAGNLDEEHFKKLWNAYKKESDDALFFYTDSYALEEYMQGFRWSEGAAGEDDGIASDWILTENPDKSNLDALTYKNCSLDLFYQYWDKDHAVKRLRELARWYDEYSVYSLNEEDISYWAERVIQNKQPYKLCFFDGWISLIQKNETICLLFTLLTIIGLCQIFSDEHRYRTDRVVLCTRHGRKTVWTARFLAGETFAVATVFLLFGIFAAIIFGLYGAGGGGTVLQMWEKMTCYPYTLKQFAGILFVLDLFVALLIGAMVMLLSEKSAILAMIIPMGLTILSLVLERGGRVIIQMISYFPQRLTNYSLLTRFRRVPLGFVRLNAIQTGILIYSILIIIFGVLCYHRYKRYQVNGR